MNKKGQETFMPVMLVLVFIVAAIVLILLFSSIYTVGAGERAILLTWGKPNPIAQEPGLHFKTPIAQSAVMMDVKTKKYEADASSATKDLQIVSAKVAVNYHPIPDKVVDIYREVGTDYAEKIIYPMIQDTVKGVTTQYRADEYGISRPIISQKIRDELRARLLTKNIILDDAYLVNYDFSPEYNRAIEAKQTAEQNALTEKNRVAQIEYIAQQKIAEAEGTKQAAILEAQGKAEAIRIQAEAIQVKGGAEYVQLQAIQKWQGNVPNFVGGGSGIVPFLNIPLGTASTG